MTSLDLSKQDQSTIDALKLELENSWATIDELHENELASKREASELRLEIERLTRDDDRPVTHGRSSTGGTDTEDPFAFQRPRPRRVDAREMEKLLSAKESLTAERDELLEQTVKLREDINKFAERTRRAEMSKLDLDLELQKVQDAMHANAMEVEREKRAKERLEQETTEVNERSRQREEEIKEYKMKMTKAEEMIQKLEKETNVQQRRAEAIQKELNLLASKSDKLHRKLDQMRANNKSAEDANAAKMHEIRALNAEIKNYERENDKLSKKSSQLEAKLRTAEQSKLNADNAKDSLKQEVQMLEQKLERQRRDLEHEQRKRNDLLRERDVLLKTTTQAQNATSHQQDLLRIHESQRQTLENELKSFKVDAAKQDVKIKQLDQERAKLSMDVKNAATLQEKYEHDIDERESRIVDLQKELREAETEIKRVEKAYDAIRAERNTQSKFLVDAQSKIADIQHACAMKTSKIDALQEEIRAKESIIASERFEHCKLDREHEALTRHGDKLHSTLRETQDALKHANDEAKTLQTSVSSLHDHCAAHRKQIDDVNRDRDVLNAQLTQRNRECTLLYEKVKIQQRILNQSQAEYKERVHEIKMLKLRLASHARELASLREAAASIDTLKQEVRALDLELVHERTKVKALSEELETPMNVHRWRQLKGSDPTMYELLQKVRVLQRRLITKTEEVAAKKILLDEKSKVLVELRVVLSRQPGPGAFEELRETHAQIKDKSRQIKGLQSELKMFIAHRDAYTHELGALHEELTVLRRKKSDSDKGRDSPEKRVSTSPRTVVFAHANG